MRLQTFMSVPKNEPLSSENFDRGDRVGDRRQQDGDRNRDRLRYDIKLQSLSGKPPNPPDKY